MARDVRRRARVSCAWGLARVLAVKKDEAVVVVGVLAAAGAREKAGIISRGDTTYLCVQVGTAYGRDEVCVGRDNSTSNGNGIEVHVFEFYINATPEFLCFPRPSYHSTLTHAHTCTLLAAATCPSRMMGTWLVVSEW